MTDAIYAEIDILPDGMILEARATHQELLSNNDLSPFIRKRDLTEEEREKYGSLLKSVSNTFYPPDVEACGREHLLQRLTTRKEHILNEG